ncbi:uncharacterized protein LOC113345883 [Papaver somniferum]|uniref:uncharacterized protein LOC113345883 n=1 Tax=Papaver somniferum TaxID=3469 RepID=UPI000E6F5A0D|nr:uncharacterized protein LOC113345883 [Papaver somniferum]
MGEGDGTNSSGGTKGKDIVYDSPKKNPVYHLGSSDGPGILITLIALKGTNYDEWARAIRRSLIAKRKFGFVDGTIKQPEDPDQLEEWIVFHSMVVSWINNTLDSSIRSTLGDYDDAGLLWTHLKKRFCVVSGTRIRQLKSYLSECKQGKSESAAVYYGRLNKIWDELVTYMKIPQCKYGLCTCNISTPVTSLREEDYLHYFLIGLNGMYSSLREQLLARDPLPTIDDAYQNVVNSDRLRTGDGILSKEVHENVMAFKMGQIIGYPEWWVERSRGGRGSGRGGRAGGRGRGNYVSDRGGRGYGNTNMVRANNLNVPAARQYSGTTSADGASLVGVTAAQLQQMIDKLACVVQCTNSLCLIQDRLTRKVIGVGERQGGLYLFRGVPSVKVLAVRGDSYELWHQRMGHPAEKFDKEIKNVRSDNGTEFNTLRGYFKTNAIIFETSCIGTPQQNGRVERKHQHIMNVARAVRFQANLPIQFSGECALTAAYLINRTPTPLLNNKSPYEIMLVKEISLQVEEEGVYFLLPIKKSYNIAPSSIETCWSDDEDREEVQSPGEVIETRQPEMQQQQRSDDTHLGIECVTEELQGSVQEQPEETEQDASSNDTSVEVAVDNNISEMGKGKRQKIPSSRLKGSVTHTIRENSPPSTQPTQSSSLGTPYPLTYYVSCDRFSVVHRKYLAALTTANEPKRFKESMKHPGLEKSMAEEIKSLEEQGTWELEELPPGKKALGSKYIYIEKRDENGNLIRLKARLVIFGNHQVEGLD